jgi:hypothetical protein
LSEEEKTAPATSAGAKVTAGERATGAKRKRIRRDRDVVEALRRLGREPRDGATQARAGELAQRLWELALNDTGQAAVDLGAIKVLLSYLAGTPASAGMPAPRAPANASTAGGTINVLNLPHFTADDLAQAAASLRAWEQVPPGHEPETSDRLLPG